MIMIGAMAANSSSSPCFLLSAEMKCSIGMKKLKSMNSNYSYSNSNLNTSFLDDEWYTRMICLSFRNHQQKRLRKSVVNELGGQYEEVFNDVKLELRNCFTAKAVRTVLYQLYEMNPPQYIWLHNFIAENDPADGKRFLRNLAKENQDLAERVMITRLHLYGKWIKQCDHAEIYKEISDENLELMRERLLETIIWPAADDNKTEHVSRLSCIKSPFSTPPGKGNILAAIKMAVTTVEEPILCRLDRLHNIVRKLEEIRGESSCASTPSSGTLTSDGGQVSSLDFSPRSLEKHCRPINDVMLETEVKGTLLQRLLHVEDRVAKLCMQMEEETETEKRRIEQQQEEKNKMSKKKKKSGLRQLVTSCVTGNNLKQT